MTPVARNPDLAAIGALIVAVAIFLAPALFSDAVLLPADNLYRGEPWRSAAPAGELVPHNDLIGDQIFQNYPWKLFASQEIRAGRLPIWNPHVFGGMPFLAAGQYGVLYPPGVLFYVVPPAAAYEWFSALHLVIAAVGTYAFLRTIGVAPFGGVIGGLAYGLCGFVVVSLIWPQVVGAASWLPWLVLVVDLIVRRPPRFTTLAPLSGLLAGLVGLVLLSGHFEISFYVIFVVIWYAFWRLLVSVVERRRVASFVPRTDEGGTREAGAHPDPGAVPERSTSTLPDIPSSVATVRRVACLAAGGIVGVLVAAAQVLPFLELAPLNFRVGLVSLDEVIGFALPARHVLALVLPDVFGNPTHHQYFDLFNWRASPVPNNALGNPTDPPHTVFWGIKNYVEGAGYVGVAGLVFAALALRRPGTVGAILAALAIWSYLLAFGTPLYAAFFQLPFFDQLHTPFRWLLPASFALAVLAGIGAGRYAVVDTTAAGDAPPAKAPLAVTEAPSAKQTALPRRSVPFVELALAIVGGLLLAAIAVTRSWPAPAIGIAEAVFRREPRLAAAFAGPEMFVSYQARNLVLFGLALLGLGIVLLLRRSGVRPLIWQALGIALVFAELYAIGARFNTVSAAHLVEYEPPVVQFLKQQPGPFRIVGFGGTDALRPNTSMIFGIEDVRGYDSIIPRQYVDYWALIEPPDALLYNQIANLRRPESLGSKLLDLLNVRYVVTAEPIDHPSLRLVYDGEVRVYERPSALPRVYFVAEAIGVADVEAARAAVAQADFDPRRTVVVEAAVPDSANPNSVDGAEPLAAEIVRSLPDRTQARIVAPTRGYLVFLDTYFPDVWAEVDGQPAAVYRANANFRAVPVESGEHLVEVRYNPFSYKLGLFLSFLGTVIAALLVTLPVWGRFLAPNNGGVFERVSRNSAFPLGTSLLNKGVDFAFAMLVLRMLGPENVGKYAFAGIFIGYFEILTNFGLNTLLIREVARTPADGPRYLGTSTALRLALWCASLPVALGGLQLWRTQFGLEDDTALAILLLGIALIPGNLATAYSSMYTAHERNVVPAAVTVLTTLLRVSLGALALLAGAGFIGLAVVAVVGNVITAVVLIGLVGPVLGRNASVTRVVVEPALMRGMLLAAYPLMLNHFLATIFFKVDILLLQAMRGDISVGYYSTAYKLIDGLLIIPSTFTFAVFPLISRYAADQPDALRRAFATSLRLLLVVALPISVGVTVLANPFIEILGGTEYLPESAQALRVLIWFLPFSYVNGLTQYVLIAVDQQRFITGSFIAATLFNLVGNLILIPNYDYMGAALTTVLSEVALLIPFGWCVWHHVGRVSLIGWLPRPLLATLLMAATMVGAAELVPPVGVFCVGVASYLVFVVVLRAFTDTELAIVERVFGTRVRRLIRPSNAVG